MFIFKIKYFNTAILREFDTRFNFLQKGYKVIEVGANKGDWAKYIAEKVNIENQQPNIYAIGEQDIDQEKEQIINYIKGDINNQNTIIKLQQALNLNPVDLFISRLQPQELERNTDQDCFEQIKINKIVFDYVIKTLKTGGALLMLSRNGIPENDFEKYLKLYFTNFYKLVPTTVVNSDPEIHYFLGSGFKLREEYKKYASFFQKIQAGQEDQIKEEEIPPAYQTDAERDLEAIQFLQYVSDNQIAITQDYVDQIKNHPRLKGLDLEKYNLYIVDGPLTELQEYEIFHAKYGGKLSFAPDNRSVEERLAEKGEMFEKYEKMLEDQDFTNQLLQDKEVLGEDPNDFNEEIQKLKQQFRQYSEELKSGNIQLTPMTDKEKEELYQNMEIDTTAYVQQFHKRGKTAEDILQQEIDQGNISKQELTDFFDLNDKRLIEKINDEYHEYITKQTEQKTQKMTKEYRSKYFEKKKKLKSRRQ